jgi:hypothetical protein
MREVARQTAQAVGPLKDAAKPLEDYARAARDATGALGRFNGGTDHLNTSLPQATADLRTARAVVDGLAHSTGTLLGKENWDQAAGTIKSTWHTITDSTEKAYNNLSAFFRTAYASEATATEREWENIRNAILSAEAGMVTGTAQNANNMLVLFQNVAVRLVNAITAQRGAFQQAGAGLITALAAGVSQTGGNLAQVLASKLGTSGVSARAGQIPTYDTGGPIPGTEGAPQLAVVHGGEYVLNANQVLSLERTGSTPVAGLAGLAGLFGAQASPTGALSPASGGGGQPYQPAGYGAAGAAGATFNIEQVFNTPMNPAEVANETGWLLRTAAVQGGIRTVL